MISTELKQIVDPNDEACCEYHLAHKCKEWALVNGWYLNAWFTLNEGAFCDGVKPPTDSEIHTGADTEPEAIFKACQWILEQKDKA